MAALAAATVLPIACVWGIGLDAARFAQTASATARGSIAAGAWIAILAAYLAMAEAARRLALRAPARAAVAALAVTPVAILLAAGGLDHLGVIEEYAIKRDVFAEALARHGQIVAASFLPALALGLPLGVLARRSARMRGPLLATLGIVQTIPSIALFGLLMAPLSGLAAAAPWIAALGIRGVGLAPAAIALTLYSLLPIVRNTEAGLAGVSPAAIDAAQGMGMSRRQILIQVELPLALPVILSGLRITLVQAVGLAAVAALIGAGGLGAIMFQGLFADAGDLILLGALPIVALAVAVDVLFRLLASLPTRSAA